MLSKRIVFKRSIFVSISAICFTFLYGAVCQAEMMNACVKKNSGNMRLVSSLDQCLRSERPVSWNNVPQSEIDALQDELNTLNQQLSSLENDKVDKVREKVAVLETEQIPKVTQEICEIQDDHAETRQLVDNNEVLLKTVETDVQLASESVATVNDDLAKTTDDLAKTTEDLARTTEDLASTTEDLESTVARVDSVQDLAEVTDLRIGALEETAVSIVDFEEATSEVADEVADLADNLAGLQAEIDPVIEELQDLDAINKLIILAEYITVNGDGVNGDLLPEVIFEGVNVHIRSGAGATNDGGVGLGNLIIGYNEGRENIDEEGETKRTGSHNLVIGPYHNYEGVGGLVAGCYNTVSGAYATVSGGEGNTAVGYAAAVSGGSGNTATEDYDILP